MSDSEHSIRRSIEVAVPSDQGVHLSGQLDIPEFPKGIVIFAHGSGSSRFSPRNRQVALTLNQSGIATLLFDLMTPSEANQREKVFDIPFLARRLIDVTRWVQSQSSTKQLPVAYFGASTGAAAALWAAAEMGEQVRAVVSRGGRPDLALPRLQDVKASVLLIVGGYDQPVIEMNQVALKQIVNGELTIIPEASHLFEEPGTLETVARLAVHWLSQQFKLGGASIQLPL